MRRAKIIATIGPASSDQDTIQRLLEAGVDVVRLNFSHGKPEDHAAIVERIRTASSKIGRAVGILQDLRGPRIRSGPLEAGEAGVELRTGSEITITTEQDVPGNAGLLSTNHRTLAEEVRTGDRILVDNGLIELRVLSSDRVRVRAEVIEGGLLHQYRNINLPGVRIKAEALSEKDRKDLALGLSLGIDYVALSFVRSPDDVGRCRIEMEKLGRVVPIIAKIEKPEAIDHLDAIIGTSDGLMVARGDLGVEVLPERVPMLQKGIVREGNAAGKPVIIATQMLNSMMDRPRPTRAEASDVANAVWDGADALLLSGETAIGHYPILAVEMLDRIVRQAEAHHSTETRVAWPAGPAPTPTVVAAAACRAATESGAAAICCFTLAGTTAGLLAHYRPPMPIVAFSPDQNIRCQLSMFWGVIPKVMEPVQNDALMVDLVSKRLVEDKHAKLGDRVVLVYGSTLGVAGQTNSIRLHRIGDPAVERMS
jgi:pyruvate kinase